jgi:uncharacterized paraquat-inducible protein A
VKNHDRDLVISAIFFLLWIGITISIIMGLAEGDSHTIVTIAWAISILLALIFFGFAVILPMNDDAFLVHREYHDLEYSIGEKDMARICPHCVSPLTHADSSFCPSCGSSLNQGEKRVSRPRPDDSEDSMGEGDMAMICPHCAAPLSHAHSSHCPRCGESIHKNNRRL